MSNEYNFQYIPLNGHLPGELMVKQTQDAINDIGNRTVGAEKTANKSKETAQDALDASADAVETVNDMETRVQTLEDEYAGLGNTHFMGVHSSGNQDPNYDGGGATGTDSIAIGKSASADDDNAIAIGTNASADSEGSIAIGRYSYAESTSSGANSIAIGDDARSHGDNSIAIGNGEIEVSGDYSVVIGNNAQASGDNCIVIGVGNRSTMSYDDSIAIGHANVQAKGGIALGYGNVLQNANNGIAIGGAYNENVGEDDSTYAKKENAIAIGKAAVSNGENSVAIGSNSVASADNEFSIGKPADGNDAEYTRKITHVADGEDDTDAVNKGQMDTAIGGAYTAGDGLTLTDGEFSVKAWTNVTVDSNGVSVTGSGSVASGNTGLINGGIAYNELRPTKDGTWVKTAQTTAVNLEKLEGGLEYAYAVLSRQYDQLKKYVNGNYYDYDTDDDVAYTKTVPSGAMPYASLDKVGGKTIVWNQLVDTGSTTVSTISGRKYYTLIDGTASIIASNGTAISVVDDTADMVCDLTLMFGAGNEPTTVAEFESMFPADYYAYNAGTLLSAEVTEVVSKDSNDTTLQTYAIPAAIQALTGYGWSARTAYNYIDFEKKVFVKRVGKTVMNGVNYPITGIWPTPNPNGTAVYTPYLPFTHNAFAIISDRFIKSYYSQTEMKLMTFGGTSGVESSNTFILPSTVADVESANQWFANNPTTFYYALDTPIETDISAYLTDNLIEVEVGGTLTFPNSNGNDYLIPVPSKETYMIDLSV